MFLTDKFAGDGRAFKNMDLGSLNGIDACLTTYDFGVNYVSDLENPSFIQALRQSSKNIMHTVVNSSVYDNELSDQGMLPWKKVAIAIDSILAFILVVAAVVIWKKTRREVNR